METGVKDSNKNNVNTESPEFVSLYYLEVYRYRIELEGARKTSTRTFEESEDVLTGPCWQTVTANGSAFALEG